MSWPTSRVDKPPRMSERPKRVMLAITSRRCGSLCASMSRYVPISHSEGTLCRATNSSSSSEGWSATWRSSKTMPSVPASPLRCKALATASNN
jgi:hypothetical protein